MIRGNSSRMVGVGCLLFLIPVLLLYSCSGEVRDSESAVRRIVRAYGGTERVEQLKHFTGKGFMKNLSSTVVASSYVFDMYQKGNRFKHVLQKVSKGRLTDVMVTYFDGTEGAQWQYTEGDKGFVEWERRMLQYRFPLVLSWMQESGRAGEVVGAGDDREVFRLRYRNGDDIVTLTLDRKDWLLREVEVNSAVDSSFSYTERYSDYRMVDGVQFPNRFTGFIGGKKYYEIFVPVIEWGVELPDSIFKVTVSDTAKIARPEPRTVPIEKP